MRVYRQAPELQAFINQPGDIQFGLLLTRRLADIERDGFSMEDLARFVVIDSGDSVAALEGHLETVLIDPNGYPRWEYIEDHGSVFEMVFVLTSSGYGALVFVPKSDAPAALLALCTAHALVGQ